MFTLETYPILYQGEKVKKAVRVSFVTQKKMTQVVLMVASKELGDFASDEEIDDAMHLWFSFYIFRKDGRVAGKWELLSSHFNIFSAYRIVQMLEQIPRISKALLGEICDASLGSPTDRVIRLLGQETYQRIMGEVPENFLPTLQLLAEKGVACKRDPVERELRAGTIDYSPVLAAMGVRSLGMLSREDAIVEPCLPYVHRYYSGIDIRRYGALYREIVVWIVRNGITDPALIVGAALLACERARVNVVLNLRDLDAMLSRPFRPEDQVGSVVTFILQEFPGTCLEDYTAEIASLPRRLGPFSEEFLRVET